MNICNYDTDLLGTDILLVHEICIERDENGRLPLGCPEELIIVVIRPPRY